MKQPKLPTILKQWSVQCAISENILQNFKTKIKTSREENYKNVMERILIEINDKEKRLTDYQHKLEFQTGWPYFKLQNFDLKYLSSNCGSQSDCYMRSHQSTKNYPYRCKFGIQHSMNSKKVALPPCDILIYETFHNKYISKGQIIKFNGLQSTKANMEYISDDLFLLEKDKEIDIKQQSNSFANNDAYRNLVFLVKTTM